MPGLRVALALAVLLGTPAGHRAAQALWTGVEVDAEAPLEGPESPGPEGFKFEAFGAPPAVRKRPGSVGSALPGARGFLRPWPTPHLGPSRCRPESPDAIPSPEGGRALRTRIQSHTC